MSAIKAGDLVVVVGGCDCYIGHMFDVRGFMTFEAPTQLICGEKWHSVAYRGVFAKSYARAFPLPWLRRIPPLAELRYADRFEEEKV